MSVVIETLAKPQGQNPPGIVEVFILPLEAVADFQTLSLKDAAKYYRVWLGASEAGYSDRLNDSGDGGYFSYQLDITIAGSTPHLESICRHKHILLFRDYLGYLYRTGSEENPFRCEAQQRNNNALNYRLRLSGDGPLSFRTIEGISESSGLIDLTPNDGEHTPGIVSATIFFAHEVISLPEVNTSGIMSGDPVVLDTAKGWQIACAELEAGYEYNIKRDKLGLYYEQEISIDWPGISDLDHFNRYKNAYFIVFTRDFQGQQRCFGTLEQPLKASVRTNVAGGRGRDITFSGETYQRPAVFAGVFQTGTRPDPVPVVTGMVDFEPGDFEADDFL